MKKNNLPTKTNNYLKPFAPNTAIIYSKSSSLETIPERMDLMASGVQQVEDLNRGRRRSIGGFISVATRGVGVECTDADDLPALF